MRIFNPVEFDGIKYGRFATIKGIEFDPFELLLNTLIKSN